MRFRKRRWASVQARLRAQIAIVQAGETFGLAGGATTGPLILELRLDLNWQRGSGAGQHPIGLGDPVHPAFQLQIILEQLQLTADPPSTRCSTPRISAATLRHCLQDC